MKGNNPVKVTDASKVPFGAKDVIGKSNPWKAETKVRIHFAGRINFNRNFKRDVIHKKKPSMDDLKERLAEQGVIPEFIRMSISTFVKHFTKRNFDAQVKA